ncbi:hypothetical protein MASR1M60_00660 [Rhodocyclaceae bacterium]
MKLARKLKKLLHRNYLNDDPSIYRRFGMLWLLNYKNYIDRKLILGECYEKEQLAYCRQVIENNRVQAFIDVGANFGLYSLMMAKQFPELTTVLAFEADRRNFNCLSANIYLNGLDQCIAARPIGLSDRQGEVVFLVNKGNSTGMSRIAATAPDTTKMGMFEEVGISVDTLDAQTTGLNGQSVYIKIDVEGHEMAVIAGARDFLRSNRCFLQMEILSNQQETVAALHHDYGLNCIHHIENDFFFEKG